MNANQLLYTTNKVENWTARFSSYPILRIQVAIKNFFHRGLHNLYHKYKYQTLSVNYHSMISVV